MRLVAQTCLYALCCAAAHAAPVVAVDPNNTLAGGSNGYIIGTTVANYTLGYSFTATENLHATELGIYDGGSGGPGTDRQVGIFELVSGTWTLRTSTPFAASEPATHRIGYYIYHDIPDLDLVGGRTYALMVSGYYGGAQSPLYNRSTTTLSGISYGQALYNAINNTSAAFAGPNFFVDSGSYLSGRYGYVGGNFLYDNAVRSVPEPVSLALTGLALALLGLVGRSDPAQ